MVTPVRTLFFGSGPLALPALTGLLDSGLVDIVAVITAPPRPSGRKQTLTPTPVAELADARGLVVLAPSSLRGEGVLEELRSTDAELIVLADYGRIIPPSVLALPRLGALNVHPSLLPRHRGAAPVQGAIAAGDTVSGVTIMRMDEGLDSGPIVAQVSLPLAGDEVAPALEARLAALGANLLIDVLPDWLEDRRPARPQPSHGISLTRPLQREDGRLDPTRSAAELERLVRAYQPWPGTFVEAEGKRLKVWAAAVEPSALPAGAVASGDLVRCGDTVALATADGLLRLDEVQPEGGRRMSGADYRRGQRL